MDILRTTVTEIYHIARQKLLIALLMVRNFQIAKKYSTEKIQIYERSK